MRRRIDELRMVVPELIDEVTAIFFADELLIWLQVARVSKAKGSGFL
jgi:hypothetical protein